MKKLAVLLLLMTTLFHGPHPAQAFPTSRISQPHKPSLTENVQWDSDRRGAQRANDGAAIFGVITRIATMIVGHGVITTDAIVIQMQRL